MRLQAWPDAVPQPVKRANRWANTSQHLCCAGVANVSDTYGAALWTLDVMFETAAAGVTGVNFHCEARAC